MTTFIRLLEASPDTKESVLAESAKAWRNGGGHATIFEASPSDFRHIPESPFAYWVSNSVRVLFSDLSPFKSEERLARQGLATADDFRYLRIWSEAEEVEIGQKWFSLAKGGAYSPFYADLPMIANWADGGREAKAWAGSLYGGSHWSRILKNVDYYFRPGLTYPRRMARFCPQAMPEGTIISVRGSGIYAPDNLAGYLALLSSTPFDRLVKLLLGREGHPQFDNGAIDKTPLPDLDESAANSLRQLGVRAWSVVRHAAASGQLSRSFVLPSLLRVEGDTVAARVDAWSARIAEGEAELERIQVEIDEIAFELYGIRGADRSQMLAGVGETASANDDTEATDDEEDEAESEGADPAALIESLLEWALGTALGRFDIRLATGERPPPPEPDPFDPLPVCSPGMLQTEDGFPLGEPPAGYPLDLPPHGILVDDAGHPWDVIARIEAVLELVAGDRGHAWLGEVEGILGRDLRDWLRRYGFERHLKRYSRSRRKAPLFWHLAPKSREYGIWLYSPAATRDTFYRIQNDYVDPRLKSAERRLLELRQQAGSSPTGQQRKDLTAQESLVEELRAFREQVAVVAPLWRPFRDDGVVLNCAVLSRLFDHHRAWQKECAKKWGELADGKYDWAGWAMHLWPDRVVATCTSDRSIAIAHGLEEAFWREDEEGKWKTRPDAKAAAAALVAERRSPAVEAALDAWQRAG